MKRTTSTALVILSVLLLCFQNCSNVQFAEMAEKSSASVSNRVQTILPAYKSDMTDPIKVLLVVDNSATMSQTQAQLSENLNFLLAKIQNYNAEVKVVTSTVSDTCQNSGSCTSNPVLNRASDTGSMIASDGYTYTTSSTSYSERSYPIFKLTQQMSESDKAQVVKQVSSHIKNIGVRGSDQEGQFAAMALHLDTTTSSFFKKGDKALILVLTDENDSSSYSALQRSKSSYLAYRYENVPGLMIRRPMWNPGIGYCKVYNEIGQLVKEEGPLFSASHATQQSCLDRIANSKDCSFSGCTYNAYDLQSSTSYALNGKTIAQRCDELRAELGYTITDCISATHSPSEPIYYSKRASYFMNWKKEDLEGPQASMFILNEVQKQLTNLFGTKYLISVMTNLRDQSCPLLTGQSYDAFFSQQLAAVLPSQNFNISSICDTANEDSFKKISTLFESLINKDYEVVLGKNEIIQTVTMLKGKDRKSLILDEDYKIDNGLFKILNLDISDFDEIQIEIGPRY